MNSAVGLNVVVPINAVKSHEAAMAVHHVMSAIANLLLLAKSEEGSNLLRSDLADLELSHRNLGFLLVNLQAEKAA